jgi:hypothetical protein
MKEEGIPPPPPSFLILNYFPRLKSNPGVQASGKFFNGICKTVTRQYAFKLDYYKTLIFYRVKLRKSIIGLYFRDFRFDGRRVVVMDDDNIRRSFKNFFVAYRNPCFFTCSIIASFFLILL